MLLCEVSVGKSVRVKSLNGLGKAERVKLENLEIKEGVTLRVLYVHKCNKNMLVQKDGFRVALSFYVARGIEVYE